MSWGELSCKNYGNCTLVNSSSANTCNKKCNEYGVSGKFIKELSDDDILFRLTDWVRIGRNEGGLYGGEREYFKAICSEVKERKLLMNFTEDL